MSFHIFRLLATFATIVALATSAWSQDSQRQYLSGHDKDDAVPWQFQCTAGNHANQWSTIPVPSNWELQGFGKFSYGQFETPTPVQGQYKQSFAAPANWASKRIFLVFEGSMTDTEAKINGQVVGPKHIGGYYRFKYDVTQMLKFGAQNQLDVTVDDESSDASVNGAERRGDYWNFGGIYRPVYLEAVPVEFLDHLAINAKADGSLTLDAFASDVAKADHIEAQVLDLNGKPVGKVFSQKIDTAMPATHWQTQISNPKLWTAETPNLYQVEVRLMQGTIIVHRLKQRFGFRTIEVRVGDGFYVNGKRIMLKGSDRHSFWPDSGRCTSEKINREDIRLMKDMNMNAVRMSHYPPDQNFLDACDEMGLYVLDELAGWHHKYATEIGHKLVGEMVVRDVNHPSVLFWDNGNEGGWNTALDDDFAQWDPQQRHVIHPISFFQNLYTKHYPGYKSLLEMANGTTVFIPTEFMHGLYDGGAGAGLADYWDVIRQSKVSAGGIIWAFVDEAVKRVDLDGHLDTHATNAPDGILGPYREKEGSYYTIKEVWSPIVVTEKTLPTNFNGKLTVENRYSFTDAQQCQYKWQLRKFRRPNETQSGFSVISEGTAKSPAIAPGASGQLSLTLPKNWQQADALALRVTDPTGQELWTYVWPFTHADDFRSAIVALGTSKTSATETPNAITVQSGDLTVAFDKVTGYLNSVQRGAKTFSLTNGPRLAVGDATLTSLTHRADGKDQIIEAVYSGNLKSVQWRVRSNGWVQVNYAYNLTGPQQYFGVSFDYPEANVKSMKWLGNGPYRVWKNRTAGATLSVWDNTYNDTITGDTLWKYPEFKGYYSNVRWMQWMTSEGPITIAPQQDDLFVQVLTPQFPKGSGKTLVAFPSASLSILNAIPGIGSKFISAADSGPQSAQPIANGDYAGLVSFYFGG